MLVNSAMGVSIAQGVPPNFRFIKLTYGYSVNVTYGYSVNDFKIFY